MIKGKQSRCDKHGIFTIENIVVKNTLYMVKPYPADVHVASPWLLWFYSNGLWQNVWTKYNIHEVTRNMCISHTEWCTLSLKNNRDQWKQILKHLTQWMLCCLQSSGMLISYNYCYHMETIYTSSSWNTCIFVTVVHKYHGQLVTMVDNGRSMNMLDNGQLINMMNNDQFINMMDNGQFINMMDNGQFINMINNGQFINMMDNDQFINMMDNGLFLHMMFDIHRQSNKLNNMLGNGVSWCFGLWRTVYWLVSEVSTVNCGSVCVLTMAKMELSWMVLQSTLLSSVEKGMSTHFNFEYQDASVRYT